MSLETKAAPANHATTEAGHCVGSEIHVAGHDHDHDERDDCGHVVEQDHYRAGREIATTTPAMTITITRFIMEAKKNSREP